jgi:hypothetical protein
MYSEVPYSFIPHGTTQGLVFMVFLSENTTVTDTITSQIAKLITLLDGITVTDSLSVTNERIITFTSEVKGFRITSSITAKKNE